MLQETDEEFMALITNDDIDDPESTGCHLPKLTFFGDKMSAFYYLNKESVGFRNLDTPTQQVLTVR